MLRALMILSIAALAVPAVAAENQVVKCHTSRARASGLSGGPALIANIPRSMSPIELNGVQMTDKKLTKSVIVEGMFAMRTPTDGLRLIARFVNCTKKPMIVQARANFLDVNQIPTESPSSWKQIFLSPLATATYEESSIGRTQVAAYLIELRPNL